MSIIHTELKTDIDTEIKIKTEPDVKIGIEAEIKIENNVFEDSIINNYNKKCCEICITSYGYQFNCSNCSEYFMNFEDFDKHNQQHHDIIFHNTILFTRKQTAIIPEIQNQLQLFDVAKISDLDTFIPHNQQNIAITKEICNELSANSAIEFNETVNKTIECSQLPPNSNKEPNITQHVMEVPVSQKASKRKFELCCIKVFTNPDEYSKHITVYPEEHPHECSECNQHFSTKDYLIEHMRSVHPSILPYECEKCDKCFSSSEALHNHMRSHEYELIKFRRPYTCDICGTTLSRKDNFRRHLRNTHRLPNLIIDGILKKIDQ